MANQKNHSGCNEMTGIVTIRDYEKSLQVVERLIPLCSAASVDVSGFEINLNRARNGGVGPVDRTTLEQKLIEDVNKRHKEYLSASKELSDTTSEKQSNYYLAVAICHSWFAIQHAACGALKATVEATGKACGYFAAEQILRAGLETHDALGAAAETEQKIIEQYEEVTEWNSKETNQN